MKIEYIVAIIVVVVVVALVVFRKKLFPAAPAAPVA